MKKRFFGIISAAAVAFASVPLTAYAEDAAEQLNQQGKTPDGTYDYQVYNDEAQGEWFFDGAEKDGGAFSCKWNGISNTIFGKGHNFESETTYKALGNMECSYEMEYTAEGISKYGIYGWMKDLRPGFRTFPLIEYYIIDGYTEWRPCSDQTPLGQLVDNGRTYDIYAIYHSQPSADMSAQFLAQYLSVITEEDNPVQSGSTASVSGTIDIAKHFEAWENAGLYMDGAVNNTEFYVEGWQSAGEANVTKNVIAIGGERIPDVTTAPENVTTATVTTTTTAEKQYTVGGKTPDGSYDYAVFNDLDMGSYTFDGAETDGGAFSCSWKDTRNTLFTKGHTFDRDDLRYKDLGNIRCDYDIDYAAAGISYFGIHGWMNGKMENSSSKRLVEFYIIDGYNKWTPSGQSLGTVVDNGRTYDIYCNCLTWAEWGQPEQYIYQYLSVVRADDDPVGKDGTASVSGTIDITKHFKAWDEVMDMDCTITDVSFCVEGWDCSGEAKVTQRIYNDNDILPGIITSPDTKTVKGDVNSDGRSTVADIILLQKWLQGDPSALQNWNAADLNGDGMLSGIDLTMMKQQILKAK